MARHGLQQPVVLHPGRARRHARHAAQAGVHVLLDDTDVILGFQELIDVANDDIRIGMRVEAIWASEAEMEDDDGSDMRRIQGLVGWMPTGEPDVDDPDLVNRIC